MVQNQEKEKNKPKLLSPKVDIIFQILFGEVGSEIITKKFLEAILNKKIESVDLSQNIVMRHENIGEKMGVLDVLVKFDDKKFCNVEMQLIEKDKLFERILYYWSRIYTKQIKSGNDYVFLNKTIEVLIVDFEIDSLKDLEYHTMWKIIETKYRKNILTDELEIHIIEIPKIYKLIGEKQKEELVKWLEFIEDPTSKEVENYMNENEGIKEAKNKLEGLSGDERLQRLEELRLKAIMDEKAERRFAIKKGLEEGRKKGLEEGRMEGRKEGRKEGREEGRKEGRKEGKIEEKKEIAKKMKERRIDISIIHEITGLIEEEIKLL